MTEREAIIKCRRHWDWLSKHPKASRENYFKAINLPANERPHSYCYACEFAFNYDDSSPVRCRQYCIISWTGNSCIDSKAEFYLWLRSDLKNKPKYARRIVYLCNKALKQLDNKEKEQYG